ncbi:hypothetical protein bpr_II162 (plasmid) [Butyrivibrio proteoclasticus B316]|uniref:site-specific DNA-methyltransferase (adenine-specific) n=2 Tax=Butyrivibrio proteoclasticus TaxID=43305 RepID=E0S3W8_BUTPB|nr:hypothetical protein bpr_II162 [Butyrivibrio proteoclasticus B316]
MDYKKEFQKEFESMCYNKGLNKKEAWGILMEMFACTLSNQTEPRYNVRQEREEKYYKCEERLGGKEIPAKLLAYLMMALNEDPNQDFLGDMYMKLSMGERAWGQIFTPYHVCEMMAQMTFDSPEKDIKDHGYVTTLDPAVGGGAMLIASAQALRDAGYDPKTQMIAVGQDVDITAVYMAFVQLAIIGCPAVVVHGDSLAEPYTGNPLFVDDNSSYWYTPMLFTKAWFERRKAFIEELRDNNKIA